MERKDQEMRLVILHMSVSTEQMAAMTAKMTRFSPWHISLEKQFRRGHRAWLRAQPLSSLLI